MYLRRKASTTLVSSPVTSMHFYMSTCHGEWNSFFPNVGCRSCSYPHHFDLSSCKIVNVASSSCGEILGTDAPPIYLKMDIEGAETGCLEALKLNPRRRPKFVSMETTNTDSIDSLHAAGYVHYKLVRQDTMSRIHGK